MKKTLLILLFPLLTIGQTKIGSDIDGEAAGDYSGSSVSLSDDGSVLAIGALFNKQSGTQNEAGSVRVYKNVLGTWTQIGSDIDGEPGNNNDWSGFKISLSADGATLAIGAYGNDGNGEDAGSVRVYKNVSDSWTQIGADIDGENAGDLSGGSVSLSNDGTTVAIGAYLNSGNGNESGSVRVYKNVSGTWTKIGADIDGEAANDRSGTSVSLSADGMVLAIGAFNNNNVNGVDAGSVRVYKNVSGTWTKIGADIDGEANMDNSGVSVSLSSDGNILAIGANANDGNGANSGSVRVYTNVSGVWIKRGTDIDGEAAGDNSGMDISLSNDGNTLAIGSYLNDGSAIDAGSVRVYKYVLGSNSWIKIGADIDGEAAGDWSGLSVSLSGDGKTLAIGAYHNDGNGINSGSVRVYNLSAVLSSDSFVLTNSSVYPNPSSNTVNINLSENLILEKVNVYNTLGQLVKTEKSNAISVNSLSQGTYYFEIITDKGKGTKTVLVK
jgi:Flp pilus assembly pilin Flp